MTDLYQIGIWITVIVVLGCLSAFADKFDLLTAPFREAGIRIPVLPWLCVLAVLAFLFAGPEMKDYMHLGHLTYGIAKVEDAEGGLIRSLEGPLDECAMKRAQQKMDDAQAELQAEITEKPALAQDQGVGPTCEARHVSSAG